LKAFSRDISVIIQDECLTSAVQALIVGKQRVPYYPRIVEVLPFMKSKPLMGIDVAAVSKKQKELVVM